MGLSFEPVWFDSFGAKSSCVLVSTPDINVLIDPGVAIMQPSFPASEREKEFFRLKGLRAIKKASKKANVIVISHYHYDHFLKDELKIYNKKLIFAKNPNEFINESQRERALEFFSNLYKHFEGIKLSKLMKKEKPKTYPDPADGLSLKKELLKQGLRWFRDRVRSWNNYLKIPEIEGENLTVRYPEGREFQFANTKLRFTKPIFHGVEFSKLGWIFLTIVEYKGKKLMHSSDLSGPIVEDYAELIIKENPDILILDGPMTYMFGYLLNRTNLERAISNAVEILKRTDTEIIIYDHHLLREPRYKEHTKRVWDEAKRLKKRLYTAAEHIGKTPKVLELAFKHS